MIRKIHFDNVSEIKCTKFLLDVFNKTWPFLMKNVFFLLTEKLEKYQI